MTVRLARGSVALLITGAEVALALWVLGVPDLGAARTFLSGSVPTAQGSVAFLELVLWAVFAAGSAVAVVALVKEARRAGAAAGVRRRWSVAVVLCGTALLFAGAAHRMVPPAIGLDGGGSVSQATQALGR